MTYTYHPEERTVAVTIPSDIVSSNVEQIRTTTFGLLNSEELQSAKFDTIDVDLRKAKRIDSAGLNLIVSMVKHMNALSGKVRIAVSSPHIQRTFAFTRLDRQLELTLVP